MATKKVTVNKALEKARNILAKKKGAKNKNAKYPSGQNAPQSKAYSMDNDKMVSAKPTGWRWTKEGAKKLAKTLASKPTAFDIEKYSGKTFKVKGIKNPMSDDGSFRFLYSEDRADKSDLKKSSKLEYGGVLLPMTGGVNADPRFDIYNTTMFAKDGAELPKGEKMRRGGATQNYPQSKAYNEFRDMEKAAKPVGYRYTDALAEKLRKKVTDTPTQAHIEKYKGNGVYWENRADKSDMNPKKKFADGGTTTRPLYEIASEIKKDWKNVNYGAKPYLDAMSTLDKVTDNYMFDSGRSIVNYFLANAASWKGDTAKRVKAELKSMVKYEDGGYMAKGGIVVTKISDIPNFKQRLKEGKITYRGLGLGKLSSDFWKIAGTDGVRIKVDGKEYFITDKEFNTFSRDKNGLMRIRFSAPFRKFEDGGYMAKGGIAEVKKIVTDGDDTYYLTYIDSTHFYLSNSNDFKGNAYHIAEFRSRPFYNEVKSWLKSNSKMADGGMMANGGVTDYSGEYFSIRDFVNSHKGMRKILAEKYSLQDSEVDDSLDGELGFDTEVIRKLLRGKGYRVTFDDESDYIIVKKQSMADGGIMAKGGQTYAQSESYNEFRDMEKTAKPVGYRYTDALAKRLGKKVIDKPTEAHIEKYSGNGVYWENRADKSDMNPNKKFEEGGMMARGGKLEIGDMVMVDDSGYVKLFSEFDITKPAKIISKGKTKSSGKVVYFYGLEMADGRKPFNIAPEYKLTKVSEDGGMMAMGGMLEHGFMDGDNILEIYKGYGIVENNNNGVIEVLNPNQGTRFIIDLDDSKSSGMRTSMGMSKSEQIEAAKRYVDYLDEKSEVGGMMAKGGQTYAQSESYNEFRDMEKTAKPVGYRYTDALATRLGKKVTDKPTEAHIEKYSGNGVYWENRADKSDMNPNKKFEEGGFYARGGVERISNNEARSYTENMFPFKANNLEAKTLENGDYVVLSYGYYPIWFYSKRDGKWYGNKDKFSVTTARQISVSRPTYEAEMLTRKEMDEKIANSLEGNDYKSFGDTITMQGE